MCTILHKYPTSQCMASSFIFSVLWWKCQVRSTCRFPLTLLSKILKALTSRCRCVINRTQRNDSTESVNLTCQSARTVRLFCSNKFCPLCINTVLANILLVTSNVATLSFTLHQRLRVLIFLMFPPQKNIIFFIEHIFVDLTYLLMTSYR